MAAPELVRQTPAGGATSKASRELDRLERLLVDAIPDLMHNFQKIAELTDAQGRLLEESLNPRGGAPDEEGVMTHPVPASIDQNVVQTRLRLSRAYSAQIQHHLRAAVIALQFGDIASQLIAHLRDRLARMRDSEGAAKSKDDPLARTFGPVSTQSLKPGPMDLF